MIYFIIIIIIILFCINYFIYLFILIFLWMWMDPTHYFINYLIFLDGEFCQKFEGAMGPFWIHVIKMIWYDTIVYCIFKHNTNYLKLSSDLGGEKIPNWNNILRCTSFSCIGSGPPGQPSIRRRCFLVIVACEPIFRLQPNLQ